ncbi:hypothetical protein HAX54_012941, partial [Datura stramonium]|nr:hypothetical protein [Datura stramonium]
RRELGRFLLEWRRILEILEEDESEISTGDGEEDDLLRCLQSAVFRGFLHFDEEEGKSTRERI